MRFFHGRPSQKNFSREIFSRGVDFFAKPVARGEMASGARGATCRTTAFLKGKKRGSAEFCVDNSVIHVTDPTPNPSP